MRTYQKKRGWKNILQSRPVIVFLAIFLLVFAWNVFGLFWKMQTTTENKDLAAEKVLRLQKQKDDLSAKINKLNTEEGKEETIREKFPVAKDGEGVISIVDDKNMVAAPAPASKGFFSFFQGWFK